MNSTKIYVTGMIGVAALALIISCTKSFDEKTTQQKDFNNSTLAQVFIATVNATRNYVYVDGKAVTGAALVSGSVFPSTGYAFNVPAGLRSFAIRDTLRTSTQVALNFATNMENAKSYTIFTYDTITSPKQVTVPTNIEIPSDNSTRLRFANFVYAPFVVPSIDVYSFVKGQNIFANVPAASVTDFIPYIANTTDTLYIREAGSQTNIIKLAISGGISEKRSYTVVLRGSQPRGTYPGTRTTSVFANR